MKKLFFSIVTLTFLVFKPAESINLSKLQLKDFILKNNSPKNQTIQITKTSTCSRCKTRYEKKQAINLEPEESKSVSYINSTLLKIDLPEKYSLTSKKVASDKNNNEGKYSLNITSPEKKLDITPINFDLAVPKANTYPHVDLSNYHTLKGIPEEMSYEEAYTFFKYLYEKNAHLMHGKGKHTNIPKILHQIWVGSALPGKYKKWQKEWKKQHPSWRYICWSEKLLAHTFPTGLYNQHIINETAQTTSRYRFAEMADIIRYEILFNFGGTYFDTDSKNYESLKDIHNNYNFYAGLESHPYPCYVGNSIIGSIPKHPILKTCIDLIHSKWKVECDKIEIGPVERTGPALLTQSILLTPVKDKIIIFPSHFFYINQKQVKDDLHKNNLDFNGLASAISCHCWDGYGL